MDVVLLDVRVLNEQFRRGMDRLCFVRRAECPAGDPAMKPVKQITSPKKKRKLLRHRTHKTLNFSVPEVNGEIGCKNRKYDNDEYECAIVAVESWRGSDR
jgi:hypothetical protein